MRWRSMVGFFRPRAVASAKNISLALAIVVGSALSIFSLPSASQSRIVFCAFSQSRIFRDSRFTVLACLAMTPIDGQHYLLLFDFVCFLVLESRHPCPCSVYHAFWESLRAD